MPHLTREANMVSKSEHVQKSTPRYNQRSVYFDPDVMAGLETFCQRYPLLPLSMIVNVAMRRYLRAAEHGIDGNLEPLRKG